MTWDETLLRITVVMGVLVLGAVMLDVGDAILFEPGRVEATEVQLGLDGISIQEVTINSPNVYFEIESYTEFKKILLEQNSTQVYKYGHYYYIFNEDYTLAWRIFYSSIYEVIKTQ